MATSGQPPHQPSLPVNPLQPPLSLGRQASLNSLPLNQIQILDQGNLVVDLAPTKRQQGNEVAGEHEDEAEEQEPKKAWCSLLKDPPPSAGKEELLYVEPQVIDGILEIGEEILKEGAKEWAEKLVGFFLDKKLPFLIVKDAILKRWKPKGQVEVALDGYIFYFSFSCVEDKKEALDILYIWQGSCLLLSHGQER
ncbi:hypothetical protein FRX31_012077 [Thalictrum thalictroides]|uniref:DUF4283 domain-containing protein n=1 Tax=Thalictrum thalictroides TaxID=46969 RepID=A0A7J6WN23_THATH|nr:hypothetical protein FRX31_012077 [Thalictrum thalictroides]